MTTIATECVAAFLGALQRHALLPPAQLAEASQLAKRCGDTRALAQELIQRHWLSPFQAGLLLNGRAARLVIGPYLLLDRLGEGGNGQVFKARHLHLKRLVALKVLRPELLSDAEMVQRFHREAQVISSMTHPHIVRAFDAGEMDGIHFLGMEFIDGPDLDHIVKRRGALSVPVACLYVYQAALGLQHAYEKGLVHRDVKPSNLLVTFVAAPAAADRTARTAAVVKILDLGLARVTRQPGDQVSATLTLAGKGMMGTPDYLAPEQALDFHAADIRADLYSLGCTFFFLLTGQPPFASGTLAQKLMKHQQAEPPPLERFRPDVPRAVQEIIQRLLAKRPGDRFQTPADLALALRPFAEASAPPVSSSPPSDSTLVIASASQVLRRTFGKRCRVLLLGIGLLLLVGLVGAGAWLSRPTAPAIASPARATGGKPTEVQALVVPGNVALAAAGATVVGPGKAAEINDGITTGYTGYTGFAQGTWPCSWTLTLAQTYLLREIRLLLWDGNRRHYRYLLEVSADGVTYEPIADRGAGEWRSWQTITFAPRPVKYLRIHGLFNTDNQWFHLVELEAYCKPPPRAAAPRFPSVPAVRH